jgi:hypothetical protein
MSDDINREQKALDALIAGAFLPELKTEELSDAELDALLAAKHITLPEDQAAMLAKGNPFSEDRASGKPAARPGEVVRDVAMAMNRKNAKDAQSAQTRAELERKTRELLG